MVGKISLKDTRFKYGTKGFTSILNQVIDLANLHHSIYKNYNIIVEDEQILKIFENKNIESLDENSYIVSDVFFNLFESGKYDNTHNAHSLVNVEHLKYRNPKNFLNFKEDYLVNFNNIKKKLFKDYKILGIQIRGTDKVNEIPKIPIDKIFSKIDQAMKEDKSLNKIFLATDDYYYIESLTKNYGEKDLIFNDKNLFSYDGLPLHYKENRDRINLEVMIDSHLLSETNYFLYCFSNVSFLSLSLIEDYTKKIKNLNI